MTMTRSLLRRLRLLLPVAALCALLAGPLADPAEAARRKRPAPQTSAQVAAPKVSHLRPALWKVADADTTIYLFGTIHALPKGLEWLDGPVATALDSSDELVTEIVTPGAEETRKVITARALLQGETLRSLMRDEDRAAYEALLGKLGMKPEQLDPVEPWFAGISLEMLPYTMAGYGKDDGVEAVLEKRFGPRPHAALETLDYQLGLFDSLPRDAQLRYLHEVVTGFDKAGGIIVAMLGHWGKGDPDGLAKLINDEMDEPDLAEALLYQRNRNWAGWIRQRLAKPGAVFIAVGAGHLAGKGSVQDALAAQGITVTRVQ